MTWRTSSRSNHNGACVAVASWRKGTASVVGVRDTQDRDGGLLEVTPAAWRAFTAALKSGPAPR